MSDAFFKHYNPAWNELVVVFQIREHNDRDGSYRQFFYWVGLPDVESNSTMHLDQPSFYKDIFPNEDKRGVETIEEARKQILGNDESVHENFSYEDYIAEYLLLSPD